MSWDADWIRVGRTYSGHRAGRRTVIRILDGQGRHLGQCGPLSTCLVMYCDAQDADRCEASDFVRWRDGEQAQAMGEM